jgi:hypothetical protein
MWDSTSTSTCRRSRFVKYFYFHVGPVYKLLRSVDFYSKASRTNLLPHIFERCDSIRFLVEFHVVHRGFPSCLPIRVNSYQHFLTMKNIENISLQFELFPIWPTIDMNQFTKWNLDYYANLVIDNLSIFKNIYMIELTNSFGYHFGWKHEFGFKFISWVRFKMCC